MRVAALYDIHANLPALEAVLEDVRHADVDQVVVGGDIVPGPMPGEALELLLGLDIPVQFIHGNGELAVLAQVGVDADSVTYWGTTSGEPLPEPLREVLRWTAKEIHPQYDHVLRSWPRTRRLNVAGLGDVLFCHTHGVSCRALPITGPGMAEWSMAVVLRTDRLFQPYL